MRFCLDLERALCVAFVLFNAPLAVAEAKPRPVAAVIADKRGRIKPPPSLARLMGNVRVKFSDRHQEVWTRSWQCSLARTAKSGVVGWTYADGQNDRGEWMNTDLVIARSKRDRIHLEPELPFIEEWGFTADDTCVVVRSRGAHGPSTIQKFRITTRELLDKCPGEAPPESMPAWAKPFAG